MSRSVYAIAAMALVAGCAWEVSAIARADQTAAAETQGPTTAVPQTSVSDASKAPEADLRTQAASVAGAPGSGTPEATPSTLPRIVVHVGAAAQHAPDARVQVGDVKISLPSWTNTPASGEPVKTASGISVPNNTLGPGEPLWRTTERLDAERRLAEANAEFARAQAEQATRAVGHDSRGGFLGGAYYPGVWSGGYAAYGHGGRRGYGDGLRGPVTTTITRSDLLGSTAQQAWADAAYPRLNGSTDARDAIVSQFGRDATPPIVRIQNDIDRAHSNASREHPAK